MTTGRFGTINGWNFIILPNGTVVLGGFDAGEKQTWFDTVGRARSAGGNISQGAEGLQIHDNVKGHLLLPNGGIGRVENLLEATEDFGDDIWDKNNFASVGTDVVLGPDGRTGADSLEFPNGAKSYVIQPYSPPDGETGPWIFSVWLRVSRGSYSFNIGEAGDVNALGENTSDDIATVKVGTSWRRYYIEVGQASFGSVFYVGVGGGTYPVVYAWGAQLVNDTLPGVYVPGPHEVDLGMIIRGTTNLWGDGTDAAAVRVRDGLVQFMGANESEVAGVDSAVNDSAEGDVAWTNPDNAEDYDDQYATVTLNDVDGYASQFLRMMCPVTVPAEAKIMGIEVSVDAAAPTGSELYFVSRVQLYRGGSWVGEIKSLGELSATEQTSTMGGSDELWELKWTPADFATNFGVGVRFVNLDSYTGPLTMNIDSATVTIYYDRGYGMGVESGKFMLKAGAEAGAGVFELSEDGPEFTEPLTVPEATADGHALNRQTGDDRYHLATVEIPDELNDLDTAVTGTQLDDIKAKIDGIETSATADQTGTEIKAAYEAEANTNAFTDAEKTKLTGIEVGAAADQSAAEILTAIKTVDGAGSGLDADMLQGHAPDDFVPTVQTTTDGGNTVNKALIAAARYINGTGATAITFPPPSNGKGDYTIRITGHNRDYPNEGAFDVTLWGSFWSGVWHYEKLSGWGLGRFDYAFQHIDNDGNGDIGVLLGATDTVIDYGSIFVEIILGRDEIDIDDVVITGNITDTSGYTLADAPAVENDFHTIGEGLEISNIQKSYENPANRCARIRDALTWYDNATGETGTVAVRFPRPTKYGWYSFVIHGINTHGDYRRAFVATVTAYWYVGSGTWLYSTADVRGGGAFDNRIRMFDNDGSDNCGFLFGETDTIWSRYAVDVQSILMVYNGDAEPLAPVLEGASQIADVSGYTFGTEPNVVTEYTSRFGEISLHENTTATTVATGSSYVKIDQWDTNGNKNGCTPDQANGVITVDKPGMYMLNLSASFKADTNNVNVIGSIFVDGSEQDHIHFRRKIGTAGDEGVVSASGIIDVTAADLDVDLRVRHDDAGSVDVTFTYANLSVVQVGET